MNRVIISTDQELNFRAYTVYAPDMVEKMRVLHNTTPVASAALGRVIICTALMGLMLKGQDNKLTTIIKGKGLAGEIVATSKSNGRVKGYIENPRVEVPLRENGKLDVGLAVGRAGQMTVIKDLGLKEPFVSQIDLISGEIAEDFTAYFAYSEQQPSSVMLGVLVDRDYTIKSAAGCIIQMMPNADEQIIQKLEESISQLPPITQLAEEAKNSVDLHHTLFKNFDMCILDEKEIDYQCDCSRDRFEKALISIGKEELQQIIDEDNEAELVCHFCLKKYKFSKEQLEGLIDNL